MVEINVRNLVDQSNKNYCVAIIYSKSNVHSNIQIFTFTALATNGKGMGNEKPIIY